MSKIYEGWEGFTLGKWSQDEVDVRDFIQRNYEPYEGDGSFLEGPTEASKKLWDEILSLSKKEREKGGVLDADTKIISTITSKKLRSKIMYKTASIKARDNFKYKILIVDDSHTTRILQKNILTNYGYNVSTSTNPKNALEKVKQTKYDLIISDIQMPVMNGFEFILELRKIKNYENIPVIVVSSEPKENHLKEIEQTKIITYIEKNLFKQEELLSYIEKTLNY